jgi:uncharacterized membrane protein (UPF0127 family)
MHRRSKNRVKSPKNGTRLKAAVIAAALTLALAMALALTSTARASPAPSSFTFNNVTYKFSGVAVTFQQQALGLMNSSVNSSTFELFVFPRPSIYPFWMKDTYYPLDIIWINGTVVTYIANAIPCYWYSRNQTACVLYNGYDGGRYANYVIEAQSGFANRTGMKIGSIVKVN